MEILNVIEVIDGTNISVESFPIYEDQLRHDVVKSAENMFSEKAIENGCPTEDTDSYIEDGYYGHSHGEYRLFLISSFTND